MGDDPQPDNEDVSTKAEFEHPEDDDIDVVNANDIPDVDSADDVVDGDEERKERLKNKAKQLKADSEGEGEGTPVVVADDEAPQTETTHPDGGMETQETATTGTGNVATETPEDDSIDQAGSMFTDDEADELEEEYADEFELEEVDDIPDDFDYEGQDTSHYGGQEETNIRHNGVVFKLEQPSGMREDKFWSEIQNKGDSLAGMFDTMIRYTVARPTDIEERMEEENWTGFAKAGLATKCSSFLGLDALQDF